MVNKRLGDVVKQERLKLNLSQNALAEQAKVSLRTVSLNFQPGIALKASRAGNLHVIGTLNLCFSHTHIMFFRKFKSCLHIAKLNGRVCGA